MNEQVEQVAEQLAGIRELLGGFDAIGFSQGLCALKWELVFRYDTIWT